MNKEKRPNDKLVALPDISSPIALRDFMSRPFGTIAAAVTGALASGRTDFTLTGGRVLQAALRGHLLQQVGREIDDLVKKGKLKESFADEPLGFKSLQELIEFIDSEAPDEERLFAVQAMFYAINSADSTEREQRVLYELFKIAKRLSGSQVGLLVAMYRSKTNNPVFREHHTLMAWRDWVHAMGSALGHDITALIELDESALLQYKLISERHDKGTSVVRKDARLTDLGMKVCEALVKYEKAKKNE